MATLYVVATPIGNLGDISQRGVEVLGSVDLIACEDTRHSRVLLDRYHIKTPVVIYHQHSSTQKLDWLVRQLADGKDLALVSDAGTPGISDPGGVLVEKVYEFNRSVNRHGPEPISIISVSGPSATAAALAVSGFPADSYLFLGFLPKKKGRQSLLTALTELDKRLDLKTIVFFETAQRLHRTLTDIQTIFEKNPEKSGKIKDIQVFLGRELTKQFEENWRGSLAEAIEKTSSPQKGEFSVALAIG